MYTRFKRWLRCKLGQHVGFIGCDIKARTVSYHCLFCPYVETDPIAKSVLKEMGIDDSAI